MTPRTSSDMIPGAPWMVNAAIKATAFTTIAMLCGIMVWQNGKTSDALVSSNLKSVDRLPVIASDMAAVAKEMKEDASANALFMREHTAIAANARRDMDVKLAAIDARLATVMQELISIRAEQQKTYQLFLDALRRFAGEGESKNVPSPPTTPSGDGGLNG